MAHADAMAMSIADDECEQHVPVPTAAKRQPNALEMWVAGCVGGATGVLGSHPFDTLKVRMQTDSTGLYKNMGDCAVQMARKEGLGSLYAGMMSPLVGQGTIKGTITWGYRAVLASDKMPAHQGPAAHMLAGGCGGAVGALVATPIERVKILMQGTGRSQYGSVPGCAAHLLKNQGLSSGLYRGFTATVVREIPFYGVLFPVFEGLKKVGGRDSKLQSAVAGGAAGVTAWCVAFPLDVVKTRIQGDLHGKTWRNPYQTFTTIYRNEGGHALFRRGLGPTLLRAIPMNALYLTGYELTLRSMGY